MPRVFFSYYLRDPTAADDFLTRMEAHVAPAARGDESVADWKLHRSIDWPGSSDDGPDFVCVVDVTNLRLWGDGASDSVVRTHGALFDVVKRIAMTVTEDP